METKKKFDCIEMKRGIQRQVYAETKNMTTKELLLYFNGNNDKKGTPKKSSNRNQGQHARRQERQ
jgi:hypothetical protein